MANFNGTQRVYKYPYYNAYQEFQCTKCDCVYTSPPMSFLTKTWKEIVHPSPGEPGEPQTITKQRRFCKCPFCDTENTVTIQLMTS